MHTRLTHRVSETVRSLFCVALALIPAGASRADQWGSIVTAQCFALKDHAYDAHLSVRVFLTEVGGGQLWNGDDLSTGLLSLHQLSAAPISCTINGRIIRLETAEYRAPRMNGACGLCEQTGFRLTVDHSVIWEIPAPAVLGDPIFNGTIDVDKDMARICTQHRPEDLGLRLQLPAEVSDWPPPTVIACQTYSY